MGLIKDSLGHALGADRPANGFTGPRFFNGNNQQSNNRQSSSSYNSQPPMSPPYRRQQPSSNFYDNQPPTSYPPQDTYNDSRYANSSSYDTQPQYYQQQQGSNFYDNRASTSYPPPDNRYQQGAFNNPQPQQYSNTRHNGPPPPPPPRYHEAVGNLAPGQYDQYNGPKRSPRPSTSQQGFRPIAMPQIDYGKEKPFLRAYSDELMSFGIGEKEFIEAVDAINVAIIPNAEQVIFQKAANIAGWFLPGAASMGLMAGQIGVGVGAAFGHASLVNKTLAKLNLEMFLPKNLEICKCRANDVDAEVGRSQASQANQHSYGQGPEDRVRSYGNALAPLSVVLPPLDNVGRQDPLAKVGQGITKQNNSKASRKAEKDAAKGKYKKSDGMEQGVQWLMVRRPSPDALAHWHSTLQQAEAEQQQLQQQQQQQQNYRR